MPIAGMPDPAALRLHVAEGIDTPTTLDLREDPEARLAGLWAAPRRDWVRMNMIGSINGRVTGPDGTSDSLSNRADRRILQQIRAMSDAVIVGAQTVRQERHTSTRPTWLVIVTGSGDLTGHRIDADDAEASVLVCCPASARAQVEATMPGARIAEIEPVDGRIPLDAVLETVRSRGMRSLVVEGGAKLIGQFLDAGLIDEICVTQAPVFGPDEAPSLPGSSRGTRFDRVLLAEDSAGFVYQRLRRREA